MLHPRSMRAYARSSSIAFGLNSMLLSVLSDLMLRQRMQILAHNLSSALQKQPSNPDWTGGFACQCEYTCCSCAAAAKLHPLCRGQHAVARFATLGILVAGICAVSFGPFIVQGQLPQVCISTAMLLAACSCLSRSTLTATLYVFCRSPAVSSECRAERSCSYPEHACIGRTGQG